MKTIYRIENPTTNSGMWYDRYGQPNGVIENLTEGKSKAMDMPHSHLHEANGKKWFSAVASIESLLMWFSKKDIEELLSWGFRLYKFEVNEYNELEFEVLFTREGVVRQTLMDAKGIF